ncbi:unnamed protein product [Pleuronectes platessa]|uniref:Uncharacterized protein n=1 Tax=Pleuronectes platessa TaxID=8262 RepID=A0A9N7VGX6_PLEPL|nr:unnamed protein product [Pleuronectes platessa]
MTFVCNESMVISIPIGKLKDAGPADLLPEKFNCVFKDSYKIFAKLSFSLNIISFFWSVAAFTLSMIFFTSLRPYHLHNPGFDGVNGVIMSLLVVECFIALFLIYWLSKAVCRQHFNTVPIILPEHGDLMELNTPTDPI